jgi:hypothetical protein
MASASAATQPASGNSQDRSEAERIREGSFGFPAKEQGSCQAVAGRPRACSATGAFALQIDSPHCEMKKLFQSYQYFELKDAPLN